MSLIARMIIPISVIVTLATSFIGWKAYSDARDSVAEATRILEISTLDAVGRELTTVMNLTRQHLLTVADRIAIIELLRNPDESPEGERSKLLTVICGGPCSTSQASTGWPSSIAGGP